MAHRSQRRYSTYERVDAGLPAHRPAHALEDGAAVHQEGDRHQAGGRAPPVHLRRLRPKGAAGRERAEPPWGQARRPGRNAGLEQLSTPRALLPDQLEFTIADADDSVLFVDRTLIPVLNKVAGRIPSIRQIVVLNDGDPLPE